MFVIVGWSKTLPGCLPLQ